MKAFAWRMMGAVLLSTLLAAGLSWLPVLIRQEGTATEEIAVFQTEQKMVTLSASNLVDFVIQQPWKLQIQRADLNEKRLHLEMESPVGSRTSLFGELDRVIHQVFARTRNIEDIRLFVEESGNRYLIEANRTDWEKRANRKKEYPTVEEYLRKTFEVTEFSSGS